MLNSESPLTRRSFLAATAAVAGVPLVVKAAAPTAVAAELPLLVPAVHNNAKPMRVGLIGCGGRGTGAAVDLLSASPELELWSVGDMFQDRVDGSLSSIRGEKDVAARVNVATERQFLGFDAYQKVIDSGVDIVIAATCPHFRPMHLEAIIRAGKHAFIEKPVAVDPTGIRRVMEASKMASEKGLSIVCGTQRRHQTSYLDAIAKIKEGAIGQVVSARCYWNQGGLWVKQQAPGMSDMEWQLRNWLYFTWLSGDHIVEQHVHNIDVMNWIVGATPVKCWATGGRQVRTAPEYGHIFDHFAVEYEYPGGVVGHSYCRQIEGCVDRVEEFAHGTLGKASLSPGRAEFTGEKPWKWSGKNTNPYRQEHVDFVNGIFAGKPLNEGQRIAESTLTAIMGRMAAYTGKEVTWDQALNSKLDLSPRKYEIGPYPAGEVAVPGKTPLI
jgi:predicted dehydrogenase